MADDHLTYEQYRTEIEWLAEHAIELHSGYPGDDMHEVIDSEIDNHEWIIYNGYHLDILQHADSNPDDYEWDVYTDGKSWRDVIQGMAYVAMRADLMNELHDREQDGQFSL